MKIDVARLKTLDYKQLGIDHGEKIGIALVVLFLGMAIWGTNWRQSTITPDQLKNKAEKTIETINSHEFPAEEGKKLAGDGEKLLGKVDKLLVPIDPSPFLLTQSFNPRWHADKVRISKPRWLPVKDVIADAGLAELQLDPKVPDLDENFGRKPAPKETESPKVKGLKAREKKDKSKSKKTAEEPEVVSDEFKPNSGRNGGNPEGFKGKLGFSHDKDKKEKRESKRGFGRHDDADETPEQTIGGLARKEPTKGRGYRFVAVRGVYPLREQGQELANAMHQPFTKEIQDLVQINDFQLERQSQVPGADPWSGPWAPVDRDSTIELLKNEITGLVAEPVAEGVVDRCMCMPYPQRVVGSWGDMATHPDIKNFVLSEEEVEQQTEYERKLIEKMKEVREKKTTATDKKGWSGVAPNYRTLGRFLGGGTTKTFEDQILEELQNPKTADQQAIDEKLRNYIRTRGSPSQHLLLFRYLDFTVEPGKAYRYRLKLIVHNPFGDKAREEVADPSITMGKDRETEYSEPTTPVYVPEDARFFLARADDRVGRPSLPSVDMDLYQWFQSTGTVVNQLIHAQIGQFIGGKESAQVLRPAEQTFDKEKVPFSTGRALVDVSRRFSLDSTLHADILNAITSADGKRMEVTAPDEALVVDEHGNLMLLDGNEQRSDHEQMKSRYKQQISPWKYLLEKDSKDEKKGSLDTRAGGGPAQKKGQSIRRTKRDDY